MPPKKAQWGFMPGLTAVMGGTELQSFSSRQRTSKEKVVDAVADVLEWLGGGALTFRMCA